MENQTQFDGRNKSVVSMGDWLVTMLIMCIPIANLVMLFIWAFGGSTPESKSNWAKAQLIWMVIGVILVILLWSTIAALFIGSMR